MTGSPLFQIAYQDAHLLVIDKAPGLVVHPARGHREGTLAQLLGPLAAGGEKDRAGIVHRLDRDTSGLLVVSRSDEAHRLLQAALGGAAHRARVHRLGGGTPAGAQRDDRGADRTRSARTHAYDRRWLQAARGAHPLHARPCASGHVAAAAAPGHGSHPSDPRPPAGDRPSRLRATPSTAPRTCSGWSVSSCTPRASPSQHPFTGAPVEVISPLPADLQSALEEAEELS